jgi:hypothetical protein
VLDPLLYGAARAFDYLGFRGQDMLDQVGNEIVQFGIEAGYFERSENPHEMTGNVARFFTENGYCSSASANQNGDALTIAMSSWRFLPLMRKLRDRNSYLLTCPVCIANNAITKSAGGVVERISEDITPDGNWTMQIRIVPGTQSTKTSVIPIHPADFTKTRLGDQLNEYIGIPAFEAFTYGLACGFEYLGAQGQLLLDKVGHGMLEFLREERSLEFSGELRDSLNSLSSFMTDGGLATDIEPRLSESEVSVNFKGYRYLPVLNKLIAGGKRLVSCPYTLAARALIQENRLAAGEMKWQTSAEAAKLTIPVVDVDRAGFDEEKVASMMDSA